MNLVEKAGRRMVARHADVRDRKTLTAAFDEPDPEAAWELGIGVMLTGVWNTMQIATDHVIEAGHGGAIIVTSSMVDAGMNIA